MRRSLALLLALVLSVPAYAQSVLLGNGTAAAPSLRFNNSLGTGMYRFGPDSIGWATGGAASLFLSNGATPKLGNAAGNSWDLVTGANAKLRITSTGIQSLDTLVLGAGVMRGGAGSMTILAGTGASRTMTLQSTTSGGTATNAFRVDETQRSLFFGHALPVNHDAQTLGTSSSFWSSIYGTKHMAGAGTAAIPSLTFVADSNTGFYSVGADTLGIVTGGSTTLRVMGGAIAKILGSDGTGGLTISAGTGASRRLNLLTSTSGGTETVAVRFNEVQQSLFAYGAAGRPGISWASDTATGIRGLANQIIFQTGGSDRWAFNSSGLEAQSNSTQILAGNGTAAAPSIAWSSSTGTGLYRFGADTLGIATGGVHSLRVSGGASPTIAGGAGNLTVLAGTGASRIMTLQATGASGFVQGVLKLGAVSAVDSFQVQVIPRGSRQRPAYSFDLATQSGLFVSANNDTIGFADGGVAFLGGNSDTLLFMGKAKAPSLTAASGTPNTACINATTKEITENAATSCVVSSRRFKKDIGPLSSAAAADIFGKLRPSTFTYKDGGRKAIGLIAEEVDSVDSRLATRTTAGVINSVNYEQVTVINTKVLQDLVKTVQAQQKQIDALKRALSSTNAAIAAILKSQEPQ